MEVTNTANRAGDEVVQIYARDIAANITRPVKKLIGFKRVSLEPGEKKTVTFTIYANQLGSYDQQMEYVLEPGKIELMVGTSSVDIAYKTEIKIIGEETVIGEDKVFFSEVVL